MVSMRFFGVDSFPIFVGVSGKVGVCISFVSRDFHSYP